MMKAEISSTGKVFSDFCLDPRTKLYLLLVINIMIVAGGNERIIEYLKPLLTLIPILLLAIYGKTKMAIGLTIMYLFCIFSHDLFYFVPTFSLAGTIIRLLSGLFSWMIPCLMMGYILVFTTKVSEFIAAMEKLHISIKIIVPFAVMFRFFPTIREEYRSIQDAMKMRGIGFRKGPIAALEYRMVPLITSVVKIGDELSAAAMTRGLGGPIRRTNVCKIGFGVWDMVFICYVTILVCFYLLSVMGVIF